MVQVLPLRSGLTSGWLGNLRGADDQTRVRYLEGKCPTHCIIALAPPLLSVLTRGHCGAHIHDHWEGAAVILPAVTLKHLFSCSCIPL